MMITRRFIFVLGILLACVSVTAYGLWGLFSSPLWFLEWLFFGTDYIHTCTVMPLFDYADWAIREGGLNSILRD